MKLKNYKVEYSSVVSDKIKFFTNFKYNNNHIINIKYNFTEFSHYNESYPLKIIICYRKY